MENIVFREAEIDDAEEMISYLNIVGRESDNLMHGSDGFNVPVEAVKQRIKASHDADNSVILIALAGERIIARAELNGYPGSRLHHNAVFSISVRKDYWNKKIGTMLMTEIIERAKKMNLRNIELEVVAGNKAAIALYHKMGFSDVGVYKDYWFANNVYSDAIVMQRCLDD
ncbi:MAG: GNAT family N-acetyltransferase [Mogibacterium sp.]|nr:GNAT family N-acetyltransferase [Mogibacterium sp.]MBQ5959351.1 GNAT family N-acetyltransferase [Bacillota bacterium]